MKYYLIAFAMIAITLAEQLAVMHFQADQETGYTRQQIDAKAALIDRVTRKDAGVLYRPRTEKERAAAIAEVYSVDLTRPVQPVMDGETK